MTNVVTFNQAQMEYQFVLPLKANFEDIFAESVIDRYLIDAVKPFCVSADLLENWEEFRDNVYDVFAKDVQQKLNAYLKSCGEMIDIIYAIDDSPFAFGVIHFKARPDTVTWLQSNADKIFGDITLSDTMKANKGCWSKLTVERVPASQAMIYRSEYRFR